MTGLSIIISLGLAVLYTKDPVPPNIAERQRTEVSFKIFQKLIIYLFLYFFLKFLKGDEKWFYGKDEAVFEKL